MDPYRPPPPMNAPPAGWRPVRIVEPAPPRALPAQDHAAIDADEERARQVTRNVGLAAVAVIGILMIMLCGRALF
jgi:hypothetical protein